MYEFVLCAETASFQGAMVIDMRLLPMSLGEEGGREGEKEGG